jgi:hypothetical protein
VKVTPWGGGPHADLTATFSETLGFSMTTSVGAGCELKAAVYTAIAFVPVGEIFVPVYLQIPVGGRFAFTQATTIDRQVSFDTTVGVRAKRKGLGVGAEPVLEHGPVTVTGSNTEVPSFTFALFAGAEVGVGIPDLLNLHASVDTDVEFTKNPSGCDIAWHLGNFSGGGTAGPLSFSTPTGTLFTIPLWSDCEHPRIVFDGSPGTGAPPSTLGPYSMSQFGSDSSPIGNVTGVSGPTGRLEFSRELDHELVGIGWNTWSHGYEGDVYTTGESTDVTLNLPSNTQAFYFYAEPEPYEVFEVTATAQDGTTSGPIQIDGYAGASYLGFYSEYSAPLESITVSSSEEFAVGEFGIHGTP